MSLESGTRLGPYEILSLLGAGGMGEVYRARDSRLGRDVAAKVFPPDATRSPERLARFETEARSASALNHPNIVTIYDVGEHEGIAYMAMEVLEGRSLQHMLRDPVRMSLAAIADLAAQVAEALDHAQTFTIVHRDVKPANVMVSSSGRAKLTDFGVAYVPSSSMTQAGQALGSPKYMSPEQVLGLPIDPRSDIFSLGVVLFEMLTRRTPFEREGDSNIFALMHRIAAEAHPLASSIDRNVPLAFDDVLRHALAKKPEERYQRAAEMARALRKLAEVAPETVPQEADPEKTVELPAVTLRANPEFEQTRTQLIADLDTFSQNFEKEELMRLRAEEAERRRKERELQVWAEAERRRREEFERQKDTTSSLGQTVIRRAAALELLRKKAAERAGTVERVDKSALIVRIDEQLRAAFQFLSEFAVQMNEAHPVSEGPYEVMYLGEVPRAVLTDGFADYRSRDIEGKSRYDFVTFKYRVSSTKPMTFSLLGKDIAEFRETMDRLQIKYRIATEANEFKQVARASFTLTGPFPCSVAIRGDYDRPGFTIELENVRRLGTRRARFEMEQFTDEVFDEIGTYVLGLNDSFDSRMLRR